MIKDYSYEDAGFSPFLSRSIDDQGAVNLDDLAGAPRTYSRELNYDQSPTSGSVGSAFKAGAIEVDGVRGEILVRDDSDEEIVRIDKEGILVSESGTPRGRFGFKDNDFAIKVSQKGQDVTSASDDKQVMSSDFNSFKIVDTNKVSFTSTGATTGPTPITTVYSHGLGYNPGIIAYLDDGTYRFPLPHTVFNTTTGAIKLRFTIQIEPDIVTFIYDDFVGGVIATFDIKFYLLRETAR